ncbi:hypothetical protein TWF696_008372 [Orbilia brochopaga]|uniref:Isochorismatase-like domain-containing protein n=1 Tax=Orbilia brochopaga TaxID=3140254 RepID=A0AAV9UFS5_9PEZI
MRYQVYRSILRQPAARPLFRFQQLQRNMSAEPRIVRPALFVCDLQERFQKAIYNFPAVVATTRKLLSVASILSVPVYATTQNKRALGDTVPELLEHFPKDAVVADKTLFSMCVPEVLDKLDEKATVTIVGIESHICVLQTTLDLLERGHKVYVIRDGVSSCNPQEIPTALARMQQSGAIITTSESWLFELMRDSSRPEFKAIATLVKENKQLTKECLEALVGGMDASGMSKI